MGALRPAARGQTTREVEAGSGRTFPRAVRIEPVLVDEVIPQGVPSTLALTSKEREPMSLRVRNGETFEAIARVLGVTPERAEAIEAAGLEKLPQRFDANGTPLREPLPGRPARGSRGRVTERGFLDEV